MAEDGEQTERTAAPSANADPPAPSAKNIVNPGLEKVLRSAGVDPDDPQVMRTLEVISVSATMARGSLPLPPPTLM